MVTSPKSPSKPMKILINGNTLKSVFSTMKIRPMCKTFTRIQELKKKYRVETQTGHPHNDNTSDVYSTNSNISKSMSARKPTKLALSPIQRKTFLGRVTNQTQKKHESDA